MRAAAQSAAAIRDYMQARVRADHFSGTILVAKQGQITYAAGYGFANTEWRIPNGIRTKFEIGSLTKQFTAAAILMLQQGGMLSVSDQICKYLPKCPSAWQPITIHELLIHASGIPDYITFPEFENTESIAVTPTELLDRFRDKPLNFPPGERFEYSNSGYVLLGVIIERVSGQPYQEFLQHRIFDVLQMEDIGYDAARKPIPSLASGYQRHGTELRVAPRIDPSVAYAAGGLYSTVHDLLIWDRALYGNHILSVDSKRQMFTPYKEGVGYGWAIGRMFNRRVEHHNGEIEGYTADYTRFPEDHLLIVVLSNSDTSPVDAISNDLAAIAFGEKYEMPHIRTIVKLDPNTSQRYVGVYRISENISLTITYESGRFFGKLSGSEGDRFELSPESSTRFFCLSPPVDLVFALDSNGNVASVSVNGEYQAKRVQ